MENFLTKSENKISNQFEKKGYLIFKSRNNLLYKEFEKIIKPLLIKKIKNKKKISFNYLLNNFHQFIDKRDINSIRLEIIKKINLSKKIRYLYFLNTKDFLYNLVGNELVMQNKINLSIQLPEDDSSLLALHSDTWSGDSPFEIVVWFPLVDCLKTKSMYLLRSSKLSNFNKKIKKFNNFNQINNKKKNLKDFVWLKVKKGETLIFNQNIPHGNVINKEKTTRWSFNCRFKSIFSPYGDKKIGEFFKPISMRKMSEIGINYKLPKTK